MKMKVMHDLKDCSSISLTTDALSDNTMAPYLIDRTLYLSVMELLNVLPEENLDARVLYR